MLFLHPDGDLAVFVDNFPSGMQKLELSDLITEDIAACRDWQLFECGPVCISFHAGHKENLFAAKSFKKKVINVGTVKNQYGSRPKMQMLQGLEVIFAPFGDPGEYR